MVKRPKQMKTGLCQIIPKNLEYYHSLLPHVDVEEQLEREGDFLLRRCWYSADFRVSTVSGITGPWTLFIGGMILVLSLRSDKGVESFLIGQHESGTFYLHNHHEKNLDDLIQCHISTNSPVSDASDSCIRRAIKRPPWLLDQKLVTLTKKLGLGDYGEVYIGEYKEETGTKEVTVEILLDQKDRMERSLFLQDARALRKFIHKIDLKIVGIALDDQSTMMITEGCHNGSLDDYMRKKRLAMRVTQRPPASFISKLLIDIENIVFSLTWWPRYILRMLTQPGWDILLFVIIVFCIVLTAFTFLESLSF